MKRSDEHPAADGEGKEEHHDDVKPADYLREVKANLRGGRQKEAFILLRHAVVRYPDDPLVLSYFGCLQAIVDNKYRHGAEACRRAIGLMKKQESFGEDVLYPVLYLNLGRAYLAADKKKEAISAFNNGLNHDNGNSDLQRELKGLGIRKHPPVPFLDRSNPINKYIGMLVQGIKKERPRSGGRSRSV